MQGTQNQVRHYEIVAIEMPIYFNIHGDHDHDGLMFALKKNLPILKYIKELMRGVLDPATCGQLIAEAKARAQQLRIQLPQTSDEAKQPHPLVRPLVLRACKNETVKIQLENQIENRDIGIHLVSDGYSIQNSDGAHVGNNRSSLVPYREYRTYEWQCRHEGVFPFHDAGNLSGDEDGTNVHGLFGALVVEPEGAWWTDPEIGIEAELEDGLYADVHRRPREELLTTQKKPFPNSNNPESRLSKYPGEKDSFREYVILFHDEPEYVPPHGVLEPDPCPLEMDGHEQGHGLGHADLPLMPISYRAEPMINRERIIWRKIREGTLTTPVLNEEQHHSSWMFGDPATPILRAYLGDPVRIRLVHAGVKETHVFHLHVYEWHAVPENQDSPLIDAISISPQTGHTIVPLWGAGNVQCVPGDVIWHCHLYPHFHEGMWGMFRTFDTKQDGVDGESLANDDQRYQDRRIGRYPDGKRIAKLAVLPDREPPPAPTPEQPGFPLFIAGTFGQKSPVPPWPGQYETMPPDLDYRPATQLERNAFNCDPRPGELFTRFPYPDHPSLDACVEHAAQTVYHDLVVAKTEVQYNDDGWHDPDGHLFYLAAEGDPDTRGNKEPLFFRCRQHEVLELTLANRLPLEIAETAYDRAFPPCNKLSWLGECGLHVHLVKFDPICSDGASTGWNYISGPRAGKKMIYRWWADEEFGTIFFHDHLFANYRQKHGLFGALIVEPPSATFHDPYDLNKEIVSGQQAVIKLPEAINGVQAFREFCFGIGDWVPLFDRQHIPLEPPAFPGAHGDNGVMAVNYRCTPIRERPGDPAYWFHSLQHGDPDTSIFPTYPNEPIWIRLVQGSHEEQHSFQVHAMRWRRFRKDPRSPLRNQQTLGISEAFTFILNRSYGPGDYLWKLSGADDLWLGCWGLIRALDPEKQSADKLGRWPQPIGQLNAPLPPLPTPPELSQRRRFKIVAEPIQLVYRKPDLVDPFGLIYRLTEMAAPGEEFQAVEHNSAVEPLVLRCRAGEWVEIELHNQLPEGLKPEPFAPEVPVENDRRMVSRYCSIHADLLRYDVRQHDGANVGMNPLQTVPPGGRDRRTYLWYADRELGPVLLQDMADFRNHRHHGLIGALIVESQDAVPMRVAPGEATASDDSKQAWYGTRATIRLADGTRKEEIVLLLQDGLRLFLNGNKAFPIPDIPADPGENAPDTEDQGQKGFNYRCEPVGEPDWLHLSNPATPTPLVPHGAKVLFRFICAADKPRNHSFTIHGHTWPAWSHKGDEPRFASEAALSCGSVRTYEFEASSEPGDYAYRSGVLKWAVSQGLWGILRIN